jgi:hypothetical protein
MGNQNDYVRNSCLPYPETPYIGKFEEAGITYQIDPESPPPYVGKMTKCTMSENLALWCKWNRGDLCTYVVVDTKTCKIVAHIFWKSVGHENSITPVFSSRTRIRLSAFDHDMERQTLTLKRCPAQDYCDLLNSYYFSECTSQEDLDRIYEEMQTFARVNPELVFQRVPDRINVAAEKARISRIPEEERFRDRALAAFYPERPHSYVVPADLRPEPPEYEEEELAPPQEQSHHDPVRESVLPL